MKPWKVQKFFEDVVYDLRSRGLLPVVILLVVAMVAVPLLISRGWSSSSPSPVQPPSVGIPPETENAVIAYNPGVRDYKKRLNDLSPKDPFRQQFHQSASVASQLKSTVLTPPVSGGSGTASTGSTGNSTTVTGVPGGTGGGKKKKKSSKTTYTYSATVVAGEVGSTLAPYQTLTPFKNVPSLTPLPSPTTTVVVFYGLSSDFKTALFLVSNKVDSLSGPGTCVPAPDDCSLLSLAPGQSEDMHYAKDGKTYRIVLAEIKRVAK